MTVNGRVVPLVGAVAHATALEWLRGLGLTGAKEGCAEGECGACAVLLATEGPDAGTVWTPVNACLLPVHALDGQEVVTSEGLGSPDDLHPVQQQLAAAGGSQCGYCTPGFACAMAAEFYRADRGAKAASGEHGPAAASGEHGANGFDLHAIGGNLCRCTGYRPIRDAAFGLGMPSPDDPLRARSAEPAPPPVSTDVRADDGRFVRPGTLDEALRLLRDEPGALPVAGSTDWGVDVNLRAARAPVLVAIERLPELRAVEFSAGVVEVGAAVPLSEIERSVGPQVPLLAQLLPQFASRLIRNRATLGGNLGTASPIGDAAPALLALGASVVLVSADGGEREVDLAGYFTGYRTAVRRRDELIRTVRIPLPAHPGAGRAGTGTGRITAFHKIAKRRFDDISSVAVAFALDVDHGVVTAARIGLGGVAATPLRAYATEQALEGRRWNRATVAAASAVLQREGTPLDDHRASAAYRARMLGTALPALFATSGDVEEATA
ncbi:xanthine dehydrogenase small subunit [Microbacterium ureisolvens]|uniref:FAD binding domain-containing protein n=1 Tax=Microbacterium ureisolvens TaxID=2781186 RepID=A0ABS7HWH5_9MICO|nr:FAD binding domain-containing protein [Microbacterium ureisolvens]MBW9109383.1 FAD binding domain-containing protein [Microbacterium ureisolvens]